MESERSTPSQINELKALTMPRVWPISGGALFRHQIVVTLASLYPLSSWSGGRRSVDTLVSEQCPGDAGCLIGHGDQHDVCRPPRQEPAAVATQAGLADSSSLTPFNVCRRNGAGAISGLTTSVTPMCRCHIVGQSGPADTAISASSPRSIGCLPPRPNRA